MTLKNFKEKDFIKTILSKYATTANKNNFDDCICIDLQDLLGIENLPYLVYSIDHPSFIKRKGMDRNEQYKFYGAWAAACTCGDILAMGTMPKGFSFDLSAPIDTEINDIELIMKGILNTLNFYGAKFEGGNIDVNNLETVCMAWGLVKRDKIIRRIGAKSSDYIVATADLGVGWACYLIEKFGLEEKLPNVIVKKIREYKKIPTANVKAMQEVFELEGAITSGMDLTDGLIEFLYTVSENNNLRVEVDYKELPVSDFLKILSEVLGFDAKLMCFSPGYDTPLSHGWTIDKNHIEDVKYIFKKHGGELNIYGRVLEGQGVKLINKDNRIKDIPLFYDDQFNSENLIEDFKNIIRNL
ncbi:MAG: AIR synthase related protein [Defluviitaleaceae bacterium]|nr:AIR synthase related protein [Defluviitaleaceae bacterium]